MANVSDYNLAKVSTKQLTDVLKSTIEFGGNLFVLGARGSSKTMQAKKVIKDLGCYEVYLNASTMARVDFGGYPLLFSAKPEDFVKFVLPHYYKPLIEGTQPCVVIFDEVDKVDPDTIAPLLEFFQFHTVNGCQLPHLRACISTGNFLSEGGRRPPPPLLDRTVKFLVEVNTKDWLDWAGSSKEDHIHPSITAFINDHPALLKADVDNEEDYATPSPRSWHNASNILNFGEARGWSNTLLTAMVAGCVGKTAGMKYAAYFEHYQVLLPIVQKIWQGETVKDWDKFDPNRQCIIAMITCSRLSQELDKSDRMPSVVPTIGKFLNKIDQEMALMSIRSQIGIDRFVQKGLNKEPTFDLLLKECVKRMKVVST